MRYPLQRGPWTTLASKIVYQNPWMTVREDAVTRPDGQPGIFGVMTAGDGAFILPVDDDQYVYLVKDFQYGVGSYEISTVAGGIHGEDTEPAARRELLEETGIAASEFVSLGFVYPYTSIGDSMQHLFLARGLSFGEPHREGTELAMEVIRVPYVQALQWALDGTITIAASIILIVKARSYVLGGKL